MANKINDKSYEQLLTLLIKRYRKNMQRVDEVIRDLLDENIKLENELEQLKQNLGKSYTDH